MNANKLSKRLVSLILSLLMILSMLTVGLITANSAETDLAESGASGTFTVYFNNTVGWSNVYVCLLTGSYWDNDKGTGSYNQTIHKMTKGTGNYYSYTYTGNYCEFINFVQDEQNNYGNYWQTKAAYRGDFNPSSPCYNPPSTSNETKNETQYYSNGSWSAAPSAPATQAPTQAPSTEYTVYFVDNTEGYWIGNDNPGIYVGDTKMTKSVDEHTGWTVWYAKVNIANNTNVTFKRVSAIDSSTVWNTWSGTFTTGNPCYVATGNNQGSWGTAPTIPEGTATDFWYGIWVDTKGNGNTKDFVKIYSTDYYGNTGYYLYLPSFVDRSAVTIYTSLYDLKIGSTSVPRATATVVNLSSGSYNLSFKRYTGGSTHSDFKLYVEKTSGVASMFMTTKDELYTGLCSAYADNGDGTANYEGVAAYKSLVSTKGDYMFYDKDGALQNPTDKETGDVLTGIKKLKARGNSTFEASMRLYGKTAYNVTLNDTVQLLDGCKASKKYSLLANNADETMLRNRTIYGIADAVGMPYIPNTRVIDLYDNGTYLGTYVLTEKVEYGKNTLIPDAKSLDKFNEDVLAAGKGIDYDALEQKTATYTAASGTTYTYQYSYTKEAGKTYEFDNSTVTIGEGEGAETYTLDETTMKKYDFLIEHEINGRYQPEATWFVSNRTKQAVVPKYPEFATQKEVQWMIEQYDALETAAYAKNFTNLSAIADVESFASTYLIQELTENLDAGATSYYILGGKSYPLLLAAPIWDYDWAAGMYNGKKLTYNGEVDVADYSKKFVTEKSVKIDSSDGRTQSIRNLQAQMTQIPAFWTECKRVWTNKFQPVLDSYLGDGKILLGTSLPEFRSTAAMNESRWNVLHSMNEHPENFWGTRSTTQYKKGSYNFAIGGNKCTGATYSYDNTVYYLNDWLTKRREFMNKSTANGGLGLYDASMIETEAPTDGPTTAPTEQPTTDPDAPTTAPTAEPTEQPTTAGDTLKKTYYLFGYINGANYACEDDYANMGSYKFAAGSDGTLTATFTADSYVAVKENNNANWYMFKSYVSDGTETKLYNTSDSSNPQEKMKVPANTKVTFTLKENADGTLSLSYVNYVDPTAEPTEKPTSAPTVAPTTLNVEDGYYLVGTIGGVTSWDPAAENKLAANADAEGEYKIVKTFQNNDAIKVVKVENGVKTTWYKDGMDNEYVLTDEGKKTGECTVYFRPAGKEDWSYTYFTVIKNEAPTTAPTTGPTTVPTAEPSEQPTVAPTSSGVEDGYYLVGTIGGVTSWDPAAENKLAANADAEGEYKIVKTFKNNDAIKVVKVENGVKTTWYKDGMDNEYVLTDEGKKTGECTVYFRPAGNEDWSYTYFTVIKNEAPTTAPTTGPTTEPTVKPTDEPTPTVTDGYYLVGTINGVTSWDPAAENKLAANEHAEGEYKIVKTFKNNDAIKVVKVENGVKTTWYKDGTDNEYVLTDEGKKTGECTVYFRPAGNEDWSYTYFTVIKNETPTTAPTAAPGSYMIGDADGDGEITVLDATLVQRLLADLVTDADGSIAKRGKVVDDSLKLSVLDATNIQRYLAGLPMKGCLEIGKTVSE